MILKIENNMNDADLRKMIQQAEEDGHDLTKIQLEMSGDKFMALTPLSNVGRYIYGLPVKIV